MAKQLQSPTHVSLDIPARTPRRRILHRVPSQVRENKKHIYDPSAVSLGPYHHGQPQFRQVEAFKNEVVNIILDSGHGAKVKALFFRSKILERVDEIRSFYGGLSKDEYEDEALAEMMLRDACFVLYYMESRILNGNEKLIYIVRRLGMCRFGYITKDLFLLENQIPLWVIKLLITLARDDDDEEPLLYKFFSFLRLGDYRLARVRWEEGEQEPLHILEAFRTFVVKEGSASDPKKTKACSIFEFRWRQTKSCGSYFYFEQRDRPLGSVTELKAKGIHFGLSSYCLKDIRFDSYLFHAKLQLPNCIVSAGTDVFFSSMIAFEMSPESDTDFAMTSYVGFMKSLIESSKDVKELRESRVLFSTFANDEEVVNIFKEIDGYDFYDNFQDVKLRINEHCNSKAKTWMAELIHTYFRSPWNAIALFAAIVLLFLTFIQTYYTMNPIISRNN